MTLGGRGVATELRLPRSRSDVLAAALVAAAGLLHIALLPEHIQKSVLFAAVFATIAAVQLGAAWALWARPGPASRAAARWICLAVVLLFVGTRVIAPPGQNAPEQMSLAGLLSLVLELGAVAALAVMLPLRSRTGTGFPWLPALAIGGIFFCIELLSWGAVVYDSSGELSSFSVTVWRFQPELPYLTPAVGLAVFHRWSLFVPLLPGAATLAVAGLLSWAVGLTILTSRHPASCRLRYGLLGAAPATLSAPICCGPSLVSTAGIAVVGSLASLALPLLVLAALMLVLDIAWLRHRLADIPPGIR